MAKKNSKNVKNTKVTVEKPTLSILDRMETEVQANQSRVSLVLGALIVLVVGILIFNYFNRGNSQEVTPSATQTEMSQDVTPENLPGKYTIKEGDTLFLIAEKYYSTGEKFLEIAKANNITNFDSIEAGQVIEIPKLEAVATTVEPSASPEASVEPSPTTAPSAEVVEQTEPTIVTTQDFGPAITGDKYVITEGDWLSTIAARAYNGDVMGYARIAQANNITNPDYIQTGMEIVIPR